MKVSGDERLEREAFEAWVRTWRIYTTLNRLANGAYEEISVHYAWLGWKTRASNKFAATSRT